MLDATSRLFQPVKVGDMTLGHRLVMAPLTRFRADDDHVHGDLAVEYYSQRASTPGTLIITEATFISENAGGYDNVPGIWTDAQIAGWKKVTDAVHAKGSFIYIQLWAIGRAADPAILDREGLPYVSSSDVPMTGVDKTPRPLTEEEIQQYFEDYATAAANAVHKAGFDGVELHGANGYLVDQFTQDVSNKRTDAWGGSIENRCRFALGALAAVTAKVGASKTGIRLSPWGSFQDMRMADPVPTFSHLVGEIAVRYPTLAYIHFVEPRVHGNLDRDVQNGETNDVFLELWNPRAAISAGAHTRESAIKTAEKGLLVAFGRLFISNPDLPVRLRKNISLTPPNRDTFYVHKSPIGYTDYSFAEDTTSL